MSQFLIGLKTTLLSFLASAIVFASVHHFQSLWQPWQDIIAHVLYAALVLTVVFAAQFSRSRFSLLSVLWLTFYITLEQQVNWPLRLKLPPVISIEEWKMLFGICIFAFCSFIKDRGLFSIHSFYRFFSVVLCGVGAYLWLYSSIIMFDYISLDTENSLQVSVWKQYLAIEFPMAVTAIVLLIRSIIKNNLLDSAILVSFSVWSLQYYQLLPLPWSITLAVLVAHYLMVVLIDSYFLAYRDELTGLPSRRALNQLALSLGRKYTVAMLDIDHFKKFNDTYGHDIGDQVLKLVASKLAAVKGGGRIFRYGGEEFTVVFPRKNALQAADELELLREAVADYEMVIRHPQRQTKEARKGKKSGDRKTVSITISIGVAMREGKQSFEEVLKCSDQALYRAKKNGRNNVCY